MGRTVSAVRRVVPARRRDSALAAELRAAPDLSARRSGVGVEGLRV